MMLRAGVRRCSTTTLDLIRRDPFKSALVVTTAKTVAADLLVHANAPVVPVAARGANALEGDAVPFGEIGKRFRGRTNGVGSGTQGG